MHLFASLSAMLISLVTALQTSVQLYVPPAVPVVEAAMLPTPTIQKINPSANFTLTIPAIKLTAHIDSVGLGPDKLQIVPSESNRASWFKHGAFPGQTGSAVIAGHYKWNDRPAIFYNLRQIKIGDTLTISNSNFPNQTFKVQDIQIYPKDQFPTKQIYAAKDGSHLNLITCHGKFDPSTEDYTHRLVVYTTPIID